MNWTDERVELLTKLWADGLSASQIAAELGGGVSRNAVIGKVHRLKLSSRGKTTPTSSRPKKNAETSTVAETQSTVSETIMTASPHRVGRDPKTAQDMPNAAPLHIPQAPQVPQGHATTAHNATNGRAASRSMGATAFKMDFQAEAVAEIAPQRATPKSEIVVPMTRRLSLLQLSEHTCKWPEGDPLSEDFYFCGADSGEEGPYCAFHAKLAFQPLSERRRMRV